MKWHFSHRSLEVEVKVKIRTEAFNPWQEIQSYQDTTAGASGKFGATSVFIGTMRDYNEGVHVQGMTLEHYPGMTEKQLEKILADAGQRWQIIDATIVHRVGEIRPDDTIVLVAVWSSHRGDAFDACRFIMEALKSTAPFWKKELLSSGQTRWVEKNTNGYQKT
ncbi:MAG: molybdenum cofactor biosynthesis protein MoaE [Methyloglobulus sp.]|nr:molybdenum cofactor biosynthesis protein MoaE [Methyloglobulus sp.]